MPRKKNTARQRKPPPKLRIRRNAAPAPPVRNAAPAAPRRNAAPTVPRRNAAPRRQPASPAPEARDERTPMKERLQSMDGSHAAAGLAAGAIGNTIGVLLVGQGWASPKATAGVLIGTGGAATAAGYWWEADHLMAAGAGLATAGTFSLANQYAVDAYESLEKRARDKKEALEKEQREKLLTEAEARAEAKQATQRNGAPRLTIVHTDDISDDHSDYDAA